MVYDDLQVCFHLVSDDDYYPLHADILLQLVDQEEGGIKHHVRRLDNLFFWKRNGGDVNTGNSYFLNKLEPRFDKTNSAMFRVLSVELNLNQSPPFSFAICDYSRLKSENLVLQ